jgi:hypothetical protein
MSALPSVHEKNNFTDWVIATARTTEVDAYHLWRLDDQQTEAELMGWIDDVTTHSEIRKEELVLTINRIDQNASMPEVPPAPIPVESVVEPSTGEPADTGERTEQMELNPSGDADTETPNPEEGPRFDELIGESDAPADVSTTVDDLGFGEEQQPPEQDTPEDDTVVTEYEYKQFQEQVQEVVQNLINFLISYDMLSGDTGTGRPEIEQKLEQAAEQADNPSEFFQRIESILTRLEDRHGIDFTQIRQSTEQQRTENTEESTQLVDELKSSIDKLQQLQDRVRTASETRTTTPDRSAPEAAGSTQMNTNLSRNDDPRVLGSLNRLAETIQDRLGEATTTESDESTSEQPAEEETDPQPQQDGGTESVQANTEDVSTSGGVISGTAAGFTTEDSEANAESGYSSRAALFPIDLGWGLAALLYGGLDMFSTILVLGNGGQELNPIYNLLGQSIAGFVIWKTFILFVLFILFYADDPEEPTTTDWLIPIGTAVVGLLLTINNLSVLGGGSGFI